MLKKIESKNMGSSDLGWLKSKFHFSFAEYFNPLNINFGVLRVINDDYIMPQTGFDTHPHKDMEIVTYVINGNLTHGDSMGNQKTLSRGDIQYMSAGTGVYHSEHNLGDDILRLLQIWIYPDKKDYEPTYGDYRFNWDDRRGNWLHMVSSKDGNAPVKVNQDINLYSLELNENDKVDFPVKEGRQAYLVQVEGTSTINNIELNERDAMEIIEENISIEAKSLGSFIIIEMKKVATF